MERPTADYQLYYLLAHLNMFGESYGSQVDQLLEIFKRRACFGKNIPKSMKFHIMSVTSTNDDISFDVRSSYQNV